MIQLENIHGEKEGSSTSQLLQAGPGVLMTVTDTGKGIPPEITDRIFVESVTTKTPSLARGFGLMVIRDIVERLGGTVSFRSDPGRGTTFMVALPAAKDPRSSEYLTTGPFRPYEQIVREEMERKEQVRQVEAERQRKRDALADEIPADFLGHRFISRICANCGCSAYFIRQFRYVCSGMS